MEVTGWNSLIAVAYVAFRTMVGPAENLREARPVRETGILATQNQR